MRMSISPDISELSPGDEVELTIKMANDGNEDITPILEVAGLSADLWRLANPIPVIPAGEIGQTSILIRVPADTPPGDRRISVTVRSPLGNAAASAPAALRVGAGDVLAVEASPQAVTGRKGAGLAAIVHNRGSEDLTLRITGRSEGAAVEVKPAEFRLLAGQSTRLKARFTRTERSWFRERKHGVVFDVRGHTVPATATAIFIQRPVVPPVLLRSLAVLVALAVWASAVFVIFTSMSATEEAGTDTGEVVDTGPLPAPPPVVLPDPDADPAALDGRVALPVVIQGSVEGPRNLADTVVVIERVSFGDQGTTNGTGKIAASATPVVLASGSVLDKVRTTTDERGRFRVASGLRAGAFYRVSALRAGFEVRSVVVSTATSPEIDIALTLIPANGQLSGKVVDSNGVALGGATVEATQGLITYRTVTSSSGEDTGRWTIDALATPATYLISVRQLGFASQTLTVDLDGGQALGGVDAVLTADLGTIRGKISYRDSGVGSITVLLDGEGVSRETTSLTDGLLAGSFTIPSLPYGTYLLTFSGDGWMTQSREVKVGTGDVPVVVRDLVPSTGIIQGVVAQETVAGGCGYPDTTGAAPSGLVAQACGGVGVSVVGDNGTWRTTTATADGSFRLSGIPAGEYTVIFERFGYLPEFYTVVVRPGDALVVPANAVYDAALAAVLGGPDRPLSPLNVSQVQLRVRPASSLTQGTVEGFLRDVTDLDTAFDAAGTGREAWPGVCRVAMATISFVLASGQTMAPSGCTLTEGGGFTLTGMASGVQRIRIAVPRFDPADVVLRVNPEGITSVGIIALTPLASVALTVTGALEQAVTGAEVFIALQPGAAGFVSDVAAGVRACRVTNVSGMWQVTTAATTGAGFRDGVCATVSNDGAVSFDRSLGTGSYDIISPVNAADPVTASALATTVPLDHRQVVRAVDVLAGENVRLDLRLRRYGVILGSLSRPGGANPIPLTSISANPANFPSIPAAQTGFEFCEVDEEPDCLPFTNTLVQPRLSFGPEAGLRLGQYRIDRIPPNEGATLRNFRLKVVATEGLFIRSGETAITGVNFGSELIVNGAIAPEPIDIGVKITGVGGATLSAFVRVRAVTELDGARTPPEVFTSCPDGCANNDFGRGASVDAGAPTNLFDPSDASSFIDPANEQKQYLPTTDLATVRFFKIFRPLGEATFEVRAPGYVPRTVTLPTSTFVLGAGGVVTREIALTPEPRAVTGTVTVATGSVPTGLVATLTPCEGGAALSGPVNDTTGGFSFASVTPGNYRVSVTGPGIFPTEAACPGAGVSLTVPLGSGTFALDVLQLAVASQITVDVTEGGAALTSGGVSVRLTGGPDNVNLTRSVCTAAEVNAGTCPTAGSAIFAEIKPGTYTAQTFGAGFVVASTQITTAAGTTGTATLAVQRFPQITGRVFAKVGAGDASGTALAGADVTLTRNGVVATNAAGTPLSVVTDSQGRFTFPHTLEIPTVSAGSGYVVSIAAGGHNPVAIDRSGAALGLAEVVALGDTTLVNTPVTVTGSVSQAVADGHIRVSLLGATTFVTTSSTTYSIQIPPRSSILRYQEFNSAGQATDRPVVERSVVGSSGQTLTENVELTVALGGITGVIARADRVGAASQTLQAGVIVTLSAGTGTTVTVSTRSDGSFVANGISTGTYVVSVTFPGYVNSEISGVAVVANTTTTVPTTFLIAEKRDTVIPISSSAGSSLEGVTVSAGSAGQDDVVATVSAGSVTLPALQPGVWTVTTSGAPDLAQPHLNATEFTIAVVADTVSPARSFAAPAQTLQRYALITGTAGFTNVDTNSLQAVVFGTDATVSVTSAPSGSVTGNAVVTSSANSFAVWVPVAGTWQLSFTAVDHDALTPNITVPASGSGAVGSATPQNLGALAKLLPTARSVQVLVSSSVPSYTPDWAGLSVTLVPPAGSGLASIAGARTVDTFTFSDVRPATWTVSTTGGPGLVTESAAPRPHLDTVSTAVVPLGSAGTVSHALTLQRFGLISGTVTKGFAGGTAPVGWPTFGSSNGQVTVSASPAGLPAPVIVVDGATFVVWVPTTSAVASWTFGVTATNFVSASPAITVADLTTDVSVAVTLLPPLRDLVIPVVSSPAGADLTGLTVVVTSEIGGASVSASASVAGGQATFLALTPGSWQVTTSGAPTLDVPHIDQVSPSLRTLLPGAGSFTVPTSVSLQRFGKIVGTVALGFAGGGATPTGWPVFGLNGGAGAGEVTISAAPNPFANPTPLVSTGGFLVYVPTQKDSTGSDWELGLQYPNFISQVTSAAVADLGSDTSLSLTLQPTVRPVSVSVTSSASTNALAGVTVSASSTVSGTSTTVTGVTDAGGVASLELTPGKWVVTTSGAADHSTPHVDRTSTTPELILPGTGAASLSIALAPFRILRGTVFSVSDVDPALRATVSGATVTATSSAGTVTATTGNDGTYSLTLDPTLTWTISVTSGVISSGTRSLAAGSAAVSDFDLELVTEGRTVSGTLTGADGRKVVISYAANGYSAKQITLAAGDPRTYSLTNLIRTATWTITFDLYKADGTTIERSITRWVGPGNEDVVLNQDLAGAPAGNVRVRITDLGQAFDPGIRLAGLHTQVTLRDFDGVSCLSVVRTTSYDVAQIAGDSVAMDVIVPMPTGQFCVKVTPFAGSPTSGGTITGAYQDPVTISAVTPDSGSPVNAVTVVAADQAADATVMVTLRPRTRTVTFTDGSITRVTSSAVVVDAREYWPSQDLSNPSPANTFSNVRPGRWNAIGTASGAFAVPVGVGTLSVSGSAFTDPTSVAGIAFIESVVTGSATAVLPAMQVELLDASGLRITGDAGTSVTLSATDGAVLTGTLTRTSVNGLVTFNDLRIQEPGTFELSATDGARSATISVVVQQAVDAVAFVTQPADAVAGQTLNQIQVEVRDAAGARLTTYTGNVVLSLSAGTLSGTATVSAVNGVATFTNLSITAAGTYTLTAAAGGVTGTNSASFTIEAALGGVVVSLRSTFGATVAAVPSSIFLVGSNGGSRTDCTVQPDNSTCAFTNVPAGPYSVTVSAAGYSGFESIAVFTGTTTSATVVVNFTATASFTVTGSGNPLQDASVAIDGTGLSCVTNVAGQCSIPGLDPDAAQFVTVTKSSLTATRQELAGWTSGTRNYEIVMAP